MNRRILMGLVLTVLIVGCTNTRYITDIKSIERQKDMRKHRSGVNVGDVLLNTTGFILSIVFDTGFNVSQSERAFKRITIVNESADSLTVNMVTDIVWKETGYCDIMGIVLPPKAHQKLLVPYPAAYNVYFKTPYTEEDNLYIRTDKFKRIFRLKSVRSEVKSAK
jgi:hypothetical protein